MAVAEVGTAETMLSVGQLAGRVGVTAGTIRYYERAGLLPPAARTAADHRRYDASAVDRLRFIQGARRLGLRLREVQELLAVRDTGVCPCEPAEVLLRRHLEEIDAEISRLVGLRADLVALADRLPIPDCPGPLPGTGRPEGGDLMSCECCEDPTCECCCGGACR